MYWRACDSHDLCKCFLIKQQTFLGTIDCVINKIIIPLQLTASTTNFEQRDFVIRELIDTETNYLEVLNALRYKFMVPLEKLLGKDDLRAIFPRIKELAEIHERFLDKLRDAVSTSPKHKLSQVFLEFREPFLVYGEYCSNMTNAMDALRDIVKRNSMVDQMIQVPIRSICANSKAVLP